MLTQGQELPATRHLVPLPGTQWHVWRDAILRSAGFPTELSSAFAAPELAAAADRQLAGTATAEEFETAFRDAATRLGEAVHAAAADPLFRQALIWQNPGALSSIEGVLRDGPHAVRNERRRRREDIVAKYAQRYALKNDSIGFFGPMCWTTVDDRGPAVAGQAGVGLVRDRFVYFEWWALDALAQRIAADPRVRPWLPVKLQPQLAVRDQQLWSPGRAPQPLPASVAELLARCDGRPALDVAADVVGRSQGGFRQEADVLAQIDEFSARGVLRLGFDLALNLSAETALREHLERIGDATAREWALDLLDRLCADRDAAAAADSPDKLATAMGDLEATFEELVGSTARRRPGQTYAGRTLCHLDATRALDLAFGPAVLARLAPLDPLLRSARWLTSEIAAAYEAVLGDLHSDLAAGLGTTDVPFHQLWFLAQGTVFGQNRPAEPVVDEFLRRWSAVLGLADVPDGTRELSFRASELNERVDAAFAATAPGWPAARIHSPDVHLCAPDWAALARGEFTVVLGELHIAFAAFNTEFFRLGHPAAETLREGYLADVPGSQVQVLLPADWPRHSARNAEWMRGPEDVQLGFAPAPGADHDRLQPVTALTVAPGSGGLVVRAPDGRSWPVLTVFSELLGVQAFDTWKLAGGAGHTPRIVVDGLVLVRETWRTTIGATGLADATGERDRYLAARRWRRELNLPEQVFVRVATELKPCYVDLTSLVYVRLLCTLLRGARAKAGDDCEVVVTEMLPTTEQAWLTDAAGNRYTSELRLHIRDPQPAG